jgi:hypothetical protein
MTLSCYGYCKVDKDRIHKSRCLLYLKVKFKKTDPTSFSGKGTAVQYCINRDLGRLRSASSLYILAASPPPIFCSSFMGNYK